MQVEPIVSPESYFSLLPGKKLDLQINHPLKVRIKTSLVGYELGKYIILKYPKVSRSNEYKDVLVEGNVVIVRYIEDTSGQCFAFKSTIRTINLFPEKFIFITYPEQIENRDLRLQKRTNTHLPASISLNENNNDIIKGVISDISKKGCGFSFKAENDSVKVKPREIWVSIFTSKNISVKIHARVCNSNNERGKVNVGIQFLDSEQQVSDILDSLLIEPDEY